MEPKTLKVKSMTTNDAFQAIFDNPEIEKYLRQRANKELRMKINTAKYNRLSIKEAGKAEFLTACGFIVTQPQLWRLK